VFFSNYTCDELTAHELAFTKSKEKKRNRVRYYCTAGNVLKFFYIYKYIKIISFLFFINIFFRDILNIIF
jgi:hypothetical protein